jgi:DNA invertase Pin-like site-specific DNA recombinase
MASTSMKRVALYLRVSTDDQTCENQRRELEAAAKRHGWEIAAVFRDDGISGAKGRDGRPGFDRMLKAAVRREFDGIAAWSVDRLGRSLQDLIQFLGELHAKGIGLYLHQQGLDTTTPAGKAMFQMMGVFAEFERAMIVERVRSGIARKRAEQGGRWGRHRLSTEKEVAVRAELAKGTGVQKTRRLLGVGAGAVQRIKRDMAAAAAG